MILDATAGNRSMWHIKNYNKIVYLDMERQLQVKPTIFGDNGQTPFKDKTFDTIFYDPPHAWNFQSLFYSFPNAKLKRERFSDYKGCPQYFGIERYKTKWQLVASIYRAQAEFHRILKDDGLLYAKWCELKMSKKKYAQIFDLWIKLMTFELSPTKPLSDLKAYWFLFGKKDQDWKQDILPN